MLGLRANFTEALRFALDRLSADRGIGQIIRKDLIPDIRPVLKDQIVRHIADGIIAYDHAGAAFIQVDTVAEKGTDELPLIPYPGFQSSYP